MSMQAGRVLKAFGKYHLIASLGQGGMANVYLALMAGPAGFSKLLVIKVLRRDELLPGSEDVVQMFWSEARLAARLVHPNIVHTYEVGEIQGHYFLAMEYLEGQTYSAVLNRTRGEGPGWLAEHLRIVSEVARGLHYSHTLKGFQGELRGVVHRDVSPHNVFVTYEGHVKLLDFGIAKTQDADHMTQVGVIKGKLDYIAPEQLRGEPVDGRADIFALGAILWEAVAGHRFAGGRRMSDVAKVQARIAGGERRLRALRPDISLDLEQIVESAIAVDPEARFPDAASFADALDDFIERLPYKPGAKSVSVAMGDLFASERDAMHRLIHEQVERATQGGIELVDGTADMPRIDLHEMRSPGFTGSELRPLGGGSRSDTAPLAAPLATGPAPAPDRARRRAFWLGGAAAVVGVAMLATATGKRGTPPQTSRFFGPSPAAVGVAEVVSTPLADASPQSALPTGAGTEVETISLKLSAQPAHAQVTVDGVMVTMPFSGDFRRDGSLHHLELVADGYRPIRQFVKFDQDRTLSFVLVRSGGSGLRRSAASHEGNRDGRARAAPARDVPLNVESPTEHGPTPSSAAPDVAPAAPGADIDTERSRLDRDEIDQENPYRRRK
jgi:eukaryotic-like serine/threonine-protein kinase